MPIHCQWPTDISSPQSEHFTMTLHLSWYVNLSPVIRRSYTVSDWFPDTRQVRKTISTIVSIFYTVPLYQTTRSGCQMPPVAIPGLLMQPGHHPRKKMCHGFDPPFRTHPTLPLSIPSMRPIVVPLHPPPHKIWWGKKDLHASPPWII